MPLQFMRLALICWLFIVFASNVCAQKIPLETQIRILRAEDTRNFDEHNLGALLKDKDAKVRRRAALAAGRIGDGRAVAPLIEMMQKDADASVRAMAAFALGEIESDKATDALFGVFLNRRATSDERARAVEALGKIAAALPKEAEAHRKQIGASILRTLDLEASKDSTSDEHLILLGLTAALRARPNDAGATVSKFLHCSNNRIREDALNTMARLRARDALPQIRLLLTNDQDPIVRANAARVLGAVEDNESFDSLLEHATKDTDLRVRVSSIRALGNLKDERAAESLTTRAKDLISAATPNAPHPAEQNELLEIAASLGRLPAQENKTKITETLLILRQRLGHAPEIEIALARVNPLVYPIALWKQTGLLGHLIPQSSPVLSWQMIAAHAQALNEIANLKEKADMQAVKASQNNLRQQLNVASTPTFAVPDVLRAYAAFKPADLSEILRAHLKSPDVIVRSTAAELLGDLPPSKEITDALVAALPVELQATERGEMNDAALAMLDALAKQKSDEANAAIKLALDSTDHLIRRRAVALLKANGVGDFSSRIGTVKTQFTDADYRRALARHNGDVQAIVITDKGAFTIELLPDDAPLTVDNFITLARKKFFDGQMISRVVPNFVVQAGDPRGDTNGGPGYQIRCELNEVPYERGAVGMALSGKDTGGSQWFVTHSPQPHLDGGYTVFGRVTKGMDVVDNIARGDRIISVRIVERTH
jgi:cyclophilin family peptidyl-prolyl cis-trans isomerase/HEAT repeat protein